MQFDLASDIHLDCWPDGPSLNWEHWRTSDVLVFAGDIADGAEAALAGMEAMAAAYPLVLYVDGNHEHFLRERRLGPTRAAIQAGRPQQVHLLSDAPIVLDGVAFVGRNGWWDYEIAEPEIPGALSRRAYAEIVGHDPYEDIRAQALADAAAMTAEVAAFAADPTVRAIVAVTHTPPRLELTSPGIYPRDTTFLNLYGNSRMASVWQAGQGKLRLWCFGHNHDARDMVLDGVRFLSNPRGRPFDFNRKGWRPRALTVAT
ncbi:MAG: hypothetical protein EAZ99_12890 [Alphaproteobacteria bacterium]|nr:MAG: hypothetical protein EAZ99_12890 [Alphaproteobacteria bacterium]